MAHRMTTGWVHSYSNYPGRSHWAWGKKREIDSQHKLLLQINSENKMPISFHNIQIQICSFKSLRNLKKVLVFPLYFLFLKHIYIIGEYNISSPRPIHRSTLVMPPVRSSSEAYELWGSGQKESVSFITGLDRWIHTQMWRERQKNERKPQIPQCRLWLTQNVLVPHQDRLIYLSLSEPAGFLRGEEHFHSYLFSTPLSHPHFAIATFSNLLHHLNLLSYCPLDLVRPETLH